MSLKIQELNSSVIGEELGQNVYNSTGNVLLRQGVEIVPRYYAHLKENGYQSVYVLRSESRELQPYSQLLSAKLLASMPNKLREIFRVLKQEDRARAVEAKKSLTTLATAILENLNFGVQRQPIFLDLKRQDDYLYQHSINVAVYALYIGKRLGYDSSKLFSLALAALLHDFGMIFVDDEIINKTSPLDEEEITIVQQHTTKGFKHLFNYGFIDSVCSLASAQHHEHLDGTGYPHQLTGKDLHEFSRIISLTDFFDAWTSDRPHRRMHSVDKAVDRIKTCSGSQFDPRITEIFVALFD